VPADHDIKKPTVAVPHSSDPKPLRVEVEKAAAKTAASKALVLADTRRAGAHTLTWTDSATGAEADQFAVNPDVRESELGRISAEQLKNLWGTFEVDVISAGGGDLSLATRGQEIWRTLAMTLLGLVVVEACFATWAGRQR
jgi:hypothetical protein